MVAAGLESRTAQDRVAIVTGATSGIGLETAVAIARAGYHLYIPARNMEKAKALVARVQSEEPGAKVTVEPCDMASFASVRAFAAGFLALNRPLHLLISMLDGLHET